jgi:hypothetical protein
VLQGSGSEIFVIETVLCADNVVVGVLMIYGIKQQWRWVLDLPEWAAFTYLPALVKMVRGSKYVVNVAYFTACFSLVSSVICLAEIIFSTF